MKYWQKQVKNKTKIIFINLFLYLFILLAAETSSGVGHPDAELLGPLYDALAFLRWHSVGDLRAVLPVLHHEDLQFFYIMDKDLEDGKVVLRLIKLSFHIRGRSSIT